MILNEFFNLPQVFEKDMDEGTRERLSNLHDKIRKEKGLPDPKEYLKIAQQKKKEIADLKAQDKKDPGMEEGIFGSRPSPVLPVVDKIAKVAGGLTPQNVEVGKQIIQNKASEITRMLSPQTKPGVDVIEQGVAEGLDSQLPQDTLDLIDEYIAKIEPTADRNKMIQDVVDGYIHTSELEYALQEGVAEGSGGDWYAMALKRHPQLKQVDREKVIDALNDAYEDYLFDYGYEGIGPDEENSLIDYAVKRLKQGVAEGFQPVVPVKSRSQGSVSPERQKDIDRDVKLLNKYREKGMSAGSAADRLAKFKHKHMEEQGVAEEAGTKGFRVTWSEAGSDKHTSGLLLKHHAIEHAKMLKNKPGTSNVKIVPYSNVKQQGVAEGLTDTIKKGAKKAWDYATEPVDAPNMDTYKKHRAKNIADIRKKKAKEQGVAEGHADQQRKIFKKNGKPVGEVGIDRESSPGNGQWYMTCYGVVSYGGYDSYEEAVAELKHCLKQGVAEAKDDYVPPKEADYGPEYQAMVRRVGQKARAQEKARQQPPKTPVRESRRELLKQIIQS